MIPKASALRIAGASRGTENGVKVALIRVGRSVRILSEELHTLRAKAVYVDFVDRRRLGPIRRLRVLRCHDLQHNPPLNGAGGRYVWERFSQDRIMSDCLNLYRSVLDKKAPNESQNQADQGICRQWNEP